MNSLFELDCLSELSYKGTKGLTSKPLVAYRVDGFGRQIGKAIGSLLTAPWDPFYTRV